MLAGSEFHVCGAATENARRASSVRTLETASNGASDDRRGRAGVAVSIRSLRYAGVDDDITLNVIVLRGFASLTEVVSSTSAVLSMIPLMKLRIKRLCQADANDEDPTEATRDVKR